MQDENATSRRAMVGSVGGWLAVAATGSAAFGQSGGAAAQPQALEEVNGVAPGPIWTPLQVSGGATQEKPRNSAG